MKTYYLEKPKYTALGITPVVFGMVISCLDLFDNLAEAQKAQQWMKDNYHIDCKILEKEEGE